MNATSLSRSFVVPVVHELPSPGNRREAPPDHRTARASQRSLVAASLLACPGQEIRRPTAR